jgi:hypothetical protein
LPANWVTAAAGAAVRPNAAIANMIETVRTWFIPLEIKRFMASYGKN